MITWIFTSEDWYTVKGRGRVAAVESPVDFENGKSPFLGKIVIIDGTYFKVIGVESYAIHIIRKGTPIGLMVEEVP